MFGLIKKKRKRSTLFFFTKIGIQALKKMTDKPQVTLCPFMQNVAEIQIIIQEENSSTSDPNLLGFIS